MHIGPIVIQKVLYILEFTFAYNSQALSSKAPNIIYQLNVLICFISSECYVAKSTSPTYINVIMILCQQHNTTLNITITMCSFYSHYSTTTRAARTTRLSENQPFIVTTASQVDLY